MFGIVGYALVGRGRHWYKLTNNLPIRWGTLYLSFNLFLICRYQDKQYCLKQIFANNRYFEDVVARHKLSPSTGFKTKLITES